MHQAPQRRLVESQGLEHLHTLRISRQLGKRPASSLSLVDRLLFSFKLPHVSLLLLFLALHSIAWLIHPAQLMHPLPVLLCQSIWNFWLWNVLGYERHCSSRG
ncbi:hypothetical protein BD289DRAFT_429829 [Coniella lustricola]|uniref:Uncharacterized protein n=1 Tax=Coniella lustricola TaxID=2025994 RepID=A0A2T3ACQ5_9PEZI|nr:hypothetical protein BD289DRAFT_429829 [Coniella lustricola]